MSQTNFELGQPVKVFKDPQTEQELEGIAKLKEYKKTEWPFINEDKGNKTEIYALEVWIVEWIDSERHPAGTNSLRKIRYLVKVGLGGMSGYGEEVPEIPNDDDYYLT